MTFSSRRGRPRAATGAPDYGTPELRLKRMIGVTSEPIDRCLEKGVITPEQHRCGMHLRWLYTLRYGAPSLTTRYYRQDERSAAQTCDEWRAARELEYFQATRLLQSRQLQAPVMRLAIYNETPAFINPQLLEQSWVQPALAERLQTLRAQVMEGLELLVSHWQKPSK